MTPMPIGGFEGPSGRRVRSVERALSASTLLPTVGFAALGAVTVLLVALMGMPPLGEVVSSSTHDGGRAVTMPRMSISVDPPLLARPTTARDRDTTTADAPTGLAGPAGLTGPTTLTLALPAPHTIAPPRGRETKADDAQPAAMTAAATKAAVADADVTDADATDANATTWEVIAREANIAAIRPRAQADAEVMAAPEVMYMLLTRATMAPAPEPEDLKSPKSPTEDTSVTSAKTAQSTRSTDTSDGSEHAKAAKSGS